MHQTTYYLDANVTQAWHWLVEGPIRHLRGAHALSQRLWKIQGEFERGRERNSWNIFVREEWKPARTRHALIVPVNRAFVTGRIQSEILYRVSGFHLFSARFHFTPAIPSPPASIVGPSKSESPIFSRFFRELENERFAFEFISTLLVLFVDGNRSLSAYFRELCSRRAKFFYSLYFSFFFPFERVLSTFGQKNRAEISSVCASCRGFNF